ncbi:MAG: hypothetical protein FWB85_01295 [Chitinispirillia bacterium]|nr:hypothetical protein [Chitinispirillia bacterium]
MSKIVEVPDPSDGLIPVNPALWRAMVNRAAEADRLEEQVRRLSDENAGLMKALLARTI